MLFKLIGGDENGLRPQLARTHGPLDSRPPLAATKDLHPRRTTKRKHKEANASRMRKNKRERGLECAPASFANSDSSSMQPPFALKPAASAASAADDDLVIFSEEDNRGFHKPVLYPLSSLLTSSEFEFRRNPKIKEGREAISTLSRRVDSGFSSQSASEVLQSTPSESYRKVKEEQLLEVASSSTLTRRVDGGFHSSQSTRESSEVSKDPSVALNDEKCKRAKAQRLNYTAGAPMAEETLSSAMELELLSTEELNMECERDGVVKARYLLTERMYRKQSEDHEEELSRKWDTLELEHNDLKEKYKKLLQETQLKETWQIDVASQLSQIDAKQELELVTTLFSCQARDFSVIRLFASGCEGAVFLAKCTNRRLHRFKHKVFALKVLFNIFSYSTYTKVSWLVDFYGLSSSLLFRFVAITKVSMMFCRHFHVTTTLSVCTLFSMTESTRANFPTFLLKWQRKLVHFLFSLC